MLYVIRRIGSATSAAACAGDRRMLLMKLRGRGGCLSIATACARATGQPLLTLRSMPESMIGGNRVELLHDRACLPAMLAAIKAARARNPARDVLVRLGRDRPNVRGRTLGQGRAGLRVCVTYDAFGSFDADRAMFERMRQTGVDVYEYNPVRLFRGALQLRRPESAQSSQAARDRRPLGFTGGVNIADAWAHPSDSGVDFATTGRARRSGRRRACATSS